MALLSELVATCEAHRLDTGATLNVFARRLREAGRISQAGRGRGAAHMTYLDAARFLIACAATDHPERAADAEFVFSNLVRGDAIRTDPDFTAPKEKAPTLDIALGGALAGLGNGGIDAKASERWRKEFPEGPHVPIVHVELAVRRSSAGANLRILDGEYLYNHPAARAMFDSVGGGGYPVQKVAGEAYERETYRFATGKNLIAVLKTPLLRAVAQLVAGKAGE